MHWKLKEYLDKNDLTPYRLMEHSGLSSNTVYPMARNTAKQMSRDVLDKVITSLRDLTGKPTELADILRYEPEAQDA